MTPRADESRRNELLDSVITAIAEGGLGGRSLRDIAAAVGTSHRMLIHHFGSRDELLVAVVTEVERRQAAMLDAADGAAGEGSDPAAAVDAMWADVRRPEMWPFERLFFECYARGAQGEEPFTQMLPGAVDDWLSAVRERTGDTVDPALVRLGLAVSRGLLLDLVATSDVSGVDAAAAAWSRLLRGSAG